MPVVPSEGTERVAWPASIPYNVSAAGWPRRHRSHPSEERCPAPHRPQDPRHV